MREATLTASDESSRFALGCLQFRGERQQIVATDGLQLLIQRGFILPWEEDLLVEKNALFSGKDLLGISPVGLGRTSDHIVIDIGLWTCWLPLDKKSRFPRVEACTPSVESAVCRVEFVANDRQHLLEAIPHLPGRQDGYVTLDLNGHVRLTAKNGDEGPPTELRLLASWTRGTPLRVTLKRSMLARAVRLGFDHVCFQDHDAPAFSHSAGKIYVCAVFSGTTRIEAEETAEQAEESHSMATA